MKPIITIISVLIINMLHGQSMMTVREVYDFSIGDEFHNHISYTPTDDGFRLVILDKKFSKNEDTIIYSIREDKYRLLINNGNPKYEMSSYTYNQLYTDLDSPVSIIKKTFDLSHPSTSFSDSLFFSTDNILKVNVYEYNFYQRGSLEGYSITKQLSKGLGITYVYMRNGDGSGDYFQYMTYYKKGSSNYGTPAKAFSLGLNNLNKSEFLSIYPNPVKSEITLSLGFKSGSNIKINDCVGKLVLEKTNSETTRLDVDCLPSGIYFLSLENEGKVYFSKFAKD